MTLSNIFLHLSVSLTLVFIILCACSLWVTPSQRWQWGLIFSSGLTVIIFSLILFGISTYTKWPSVAADRNFVVRFCLRVRVLFGEYDVNHRNTAFIVIITVPLLMGLYLGLWWNQMRIYIIQTSTEPLVCITQNQCYPLQ